MGQQLRAPGRFGRTNGHHDLHVHQSRRLDLDPDPQVVLFRLGLRAARRFAAIAEPAGSE
jgi:hypothetical protein